MSEWCAAPRWDFTGSEPPIPACTHATCLADEARHAVGYLHDQLWSCPAGQCRLAWLKATCELPAGHDGAHNFGPRVDPVHWSHSLDMPPRAAAAGEGRA